MSSPASCGYDAAQFRREDDDLDRWRFAADIVEVIASTPRDWSARIGVFGRWGEGKTTVLRFAEQILRKRGSVVFTFNPWAVQGWNDLWNEFGGRLSEALAEVGVPLDDSWKQKIRDSAERLKSTGIDQVVEIAAAALGREKLYDTTFGSFRRWLAYDGAQVRAIREKLEDHQIVVLIDDLDRCAPDLLPQLLLSLREVLDLPGFIFVLAFDDEIVARALVEKNPAWLVGSGFLEKILDFRFHLPEITDLQKAALIRRAMSKYCPFVPADSVPEIIDLLPRNPRKLKSLVRSLAALEPQVARHDPDEFNWVDMWLAQMIRLESYPFFERLLQGTTLENEAGETYRIRKMLQDRRGGEGEDKDKALKAIFEELPIDSNAVARRLTELIGASRHRASAKFRYACELALRPAAVTWKEFRSLRAVWLSDPRPSTLSAWVDKRSSDMAVAITDVEKEILDAAFVRRQECLSLAAESISTTERGPFIKEATSLLEMLGQILLDLGKLDGPSFRRLYGQCAYWIGFRKNSSDKELRESERELILRLLETAKPAASTDLLEAIPSEDWPPDVGGPQVAELKKSLRDGCLAIVAPKVAGEAIAFLARDGSIRKLSERGRFITLKRSLFRADSPVWKPPLRDDLLAWLKSAATDLATYVNARELLMLLLQGLENGIDQVPKQDIAAILSDNEFVSALWKTAISREVQYRMQVPFLRGRDALVKLGVSQDLLPLSPELEERQQEIQQDAGTSTEPQG